MKMVCGPGRSGCSAIVDPDGGPLGHPLICGWFADGGPHPDPEKGYRFPLCREHKKQVALAYEAAEASL